jgi:hypothetical protein
MGLSSATRNPHGPPIRTAVPDSGPQLTDPGLESTSHRVLQRKPRRMPCSTIFHAQGEPASAQPSGGFCRRASFRSVEDESCLHGAKGFGGKIGSQRTRASASCRRIWYTSRSGQEVGRSSASGPPIGRAAPREGRDRGRPDLHSWPRGGRVRGAPCGDRRVGVPGPAGSVLAEAGPRSVRRRPAACRLKPGHRPVRRRPPGDSSGDIARKSAGPAHDRIEAIPARGRGRIGGDPLLAPPGGDGGPTRIMALLPDSWSASKKRPPWVSP